MSRERNSNKDEFSVLVESGFNENVLLRAEHHNWSCRCCNEWGSTSFELRYSGDMRVKVEYDIDVLDDAFQISSDALAEIEKVIKKVVEKSEKTHGDAFDGDAWAISIYDPKGECLFKTSMGYIYNVESLEELAELLYEFVPKYEEPDPEVDIRRRSVIQSDLLEEYGYLSELCLKKVWDPVPDKDIILGFLKGTEPQAMETGSHLFRKEIVGSPNKEYLFREFFWTDEVIYLFENNNIPLEKDFMLMASLPIGVTDIAYVFKEGRIGTVVDLDDSGIYTIECENMDKSEDSEERHVLITARREGLRLLKRFSKRDLSEEYDSLIRQRKDLEGKEADKVKRGKADASMRQYCPAFIYH